MLFRPGPVRRDGNNRKAMAKIPVGGGNTGEPGLLNISPVTPAGILDTELSTGRYLSTRTVGPFGRAAEETVAARVHESRGPGSEERSTIVRVVAPRWTRWAPFKPG